MTRAAVVGDLASPVRQVGAHLTCGEVDALFRADPDLDAVVVHETAPAGSVPVPVEDRAPVGGAPEVSGPRVGLVTRSRFQHQMTGRFGYGRALHGRKPITSLADWDPLVLDAETPLARAAQRVLERSGSTRFGEVLVHGAGSGAGRSTGRPDGAPAGLRQASVADLFRSLAAQYATEARTDGLTGLANREHFLDELRRVCAAGPDGQLPPGAVRARTDDLLPAPRGPFEPARPVVPGELASSCVAVMYLDLDGFKAVNDAYGHAVGDEVLVRVADRLRSCLRPGDTVARLGGDEFAVVMAHTSAPGEPSLTVADCARLSELAARRVLDSLSHPVAAAGLVIAGRVSIGLAVAGGPVDAEALLRESDLAMYRAKGAGGARIETTELVSGPGAPVVPVPDRGRFRLALEREEFVVFYQPITDATSGQLASVEALVRWQHPERGLLGPGRFLAAVHDAGLGVELDLAVLAAACRQLVAWTTALGDDAPPFVNVNLSLDSIVAADLAERVLDVVAATGLSPARLRLELPEVATTDHLDRARPALERLRAAGACLVLDDLGAGASSLHHLTGLRLDGVKIDQRFVAGLVDDERDAAVVAMLVELAHALGVAVTAEGVETEEQLHALQAIAGGRRTYAQGYLLARPAPAADVALPWPAGTVARGFVGAVGARP